MMAIVLPVALASMGSANRSPAMRALPLLAAFALLAETAFAQSITSAYTRIDGDDACSTYAQSDEGEGDWAYLVCNGYRGYPVVIAYGDLRESVFYGFPPDGDLPWESFSGFNSVSPTIEWRILRDGDVEVPFATIHRWFVSDPDEPDRNIEVLVVEKVGQVETRQGCVVGYVVATGNPDANEKARRIADTQVADFHCGDQPVIDAGSEPLPPFTSGNY